MPSLPPFESSAEPPVLPPVTSIVQSDDESDGSSGEESSEDESSEEEETSVEESSEEESIDEDPDEDESSGDDASIDKSDVEDPKEEDFKWARDVRAGKYPSDFRPITDNKSINGKWKTMIPYYDIIGNNSETRLAVTEIQAGDRACTTTIKWYKRKTTGDYKDAPAYAMENLSRLGAALMGKKVGDIAVVLAPDGEIRLKIMSISR